MCQAIISGRHTGASRTESVSYTHLDVYKRQLLNVVRLRWEAIRLGIERVKVKMCIRDREYFDHTVIGF